MRVEPRSTPNPETNHLLSQCTKVRDTSIMVVSHLVTSATVALGSRLTVASLHQGRGYSVPLP